jgi:hypothetical protein
LSIEQFGNSPSKQLPSSKFEPIHYARRAGLRLPDVIAVFSDGDEQIIPTVIPNKTISAGELAVAL